MLSGSRALGHAIPAELVLLPLGLLSTAVIFDFVHLVGGSPAFAVIAYWVIVSGLTGGFAAVVFGFVDLLMLPIGSRARRIAFVHLIIYALVLVVYGFALSVRGSDPAEPEIMSTVLSTVGAGIALIGVTFGSEIYARVKEPQQTSLSIAGTRR